MKAVMRNEMKTTLNVDEEYRRAAQRTSCTQTIHNIKEQFD